MKLAVLATNISQESEQHSITTMALWKLVKTVSPRINVDNIVLVIRQSDLYLISAFSYLTFIVHPYEADWGSAKLLLLALYRLSGPDIVWIEPVSEPSYTCNSVVIDRITSNPVSCYSPYYAISQKSQHLPGTIGKITTQDYPRMIYYLEQLPASSSIEYVLQSGMLSFSLV